jgi:hypothetical protein
LRPPVAQPTTTPVHVTPPELATPVLTVHRQPARRVVAAGPVAKPIWTSVAAATRSTVAAVDSSREAVAAPIAVAQKTVALAPAHRPAPLPTVDRSAVVELSGVDASYTSGGRAVSVAWTGSAQASATVQVLDVGGKIIATRTIRGDRSTAVVRLPRGYRGSVSIQVIAFGYHGERVVQSASLSSGGWSPVPDKQQDVLKKFKSLGFTEMGRLKNGNVFVELKSNDPVRAVVAVDGTVTALSGDLSRYDWRSRSKS